MSYQHAYNRCSFDNHGTFAVFEAFVFYIVPMFTVALIYATLLVFVVIKKKRCKKLLKTSFLICITTLFSATPTVLLYVGIKMSYRVAQIFTLTVWYATPVFDATIYYFAHPKFKEALRSYFYRR